MTTPACLRPVAARKAAGAAIVLTAALLASCGTGSAAPAPKVSGTTLAAPGGQGQLGGNSSSSYWTEFLAACKDLGRSHAKHAGVLFDLDPHAAPALLVRWAEAHDLKVQWYVGHSVASLTGTPSRLGAALGVHIDDYRAPNGQKFYSAVRQPVVPSTLARVVADVGRVSNYEGNQDYYVPGTGLLPQGMLQAYDASPLRAQGLDGSGETVVAVEVDGYTQSDLNSFASKFNLPPFTAQGGFTVNGGEAGPAEGESDMDIETIREIAPAAKIVYFNLLQNLGTSTASARMVAAFTKISKEYPGAIWTMSFGICEKAYTFADLNAQDQAVASAEAHGTTAFASSGDTAGLECVNPRDWGSAPTEADVGTSSPAVLPHVTGAGGTNLSVGADGGYVSETTWFWPSLNEGTSGGESTIFAQPSYQVGQGLPAPSDKVGRKVPDVAADADPETGNLTVNGGGLTTGGGTSLSSPIWAGFTALIDEYLHKHGKPSVGFFNPALYSLADHAQKYPPFHLITTGGNEIWRNSAGYNESTGLGSPDVYNLARDILADEGGH